MKNKSGTTPKFKFLYSLLLKLLVSLTVFRLLFLAYFAKEATPGSESLIGNALVLGFRFDLRLSLILLIPAILIINLPLSLRLKKAVNSIFYSLLLGFMAMVYMADAGYFAYLKSRLNSTVFQFFQDPVISLSMIKESYPWPLFLLSAIAIVVISYKVMDLKISPQLTPLEKDENASRKMIVLNTVIFFCFFSLGIYGSLKRYPLRWSEAFASVDSYASQLALNPILYTIDTYSFRKNDYEIHEVEKNYALVADFLEVKKTHSRPFQEKFNFIRTFPGNAKRQKEKPNIVIVIMESMGHAKTGLGGSMVNPTPHLDKLSKESMLFTKFYTPTVATARSVFAAITSLPDISRVKTGSRNPFIVNQHTTIGELTAYEKYYFLGGSANWGNIRGVLSHNIPDLKIYEEGSYQSPKVDVWGISDLNLFKEAHVVMKDRNHNRPFFALLQTSGFHRPYSIPKDSEGFGALTNKDISMKALTDYGFESLEEYNAMRLQDYSLGRFMEMAKKQSWYKNTIFLIFGDHGLPHNNALNVKNWEKNLSNSFHVPLLIHSPKYIKPGINQKIASEMDIMPTVAGLAGVPYKTRSFGKDLFNSKLDSNRAAFSYNWYAPFHLSLIDKEFYFEFIPYNQHGRLVRHIDRNAEEDVKGKYPQKYQQMQKLANGLYESARYLLHNNQHLY